MRLYVRWYNPKTGVTAQRYFSIYNEAQISEKFSKEELDILILGDYAVKKFKGRHGPVAVRYMMMGV